MTARSAEERHETIERLYEDIRRALNNREFDKAARYSLQLTGELADDAFIRMMTFPVCLECNGYAEVVDPEHPERRTMCISRPDACPGNQHGRMSPEQHRTYLDAKLKPRVPTQKETLPKPDHEGFVPRLPKDDIKPTLGPGDHVDESEEGKVRPPLVQS